MKSSDRIFGLVGPLFMLVLVVYQVSLYGTRWEFGRYFMPRTMVDASGLFHPNGTPLGPFEVMVVQSGIEEELELFMCVLLVVLFTMLALIVRRGNVLRRQLAASRAELLQAQWQRGRCPSERCDPRC